LLNGEEAQSAPNVKVYADFTDFTGTSVTTEALMNGVNPVLYDQGKNPMFIAKPADSMIRYQV